MFGRESNNDKLTRILKDAKTIAVVGLSDDPGRTSYQVSDRMQSFGYKIIPVNPHIEESLGEKSYASLRDVEEKVDIVNVFRRSHFLKDITEDAISIGAKVVWGQYDVYDRQVKKNYQDQIEIVMDECIKVAYLDLMK